MENINFVINGELYLKRGPKIIDISDKIIELNDKIKDIEYDISKENPDFSNAPLLEYYKQLKDELESLGNQLDYRYTDKFFQLFTPDGNTFTLTPCELAGFIPQAKEYHSKEKLANDFIKLSDFLNKATFVGKEFKRTKPITLTSGRLDRNYMINNSRTKYIILYAMQDLFLAKRIDTLNPKCITSRYILINSLYTLDGKYEFFGPIHEEYRDKNKVYSEILKQVNKYNKGRGRK